MPVVVVAASALVENDQTPVAQQDRHGIGATPPEHATSVRRSSTEMVGHTVSSGVVAPAARKGGCGVPGGGNTMTLRHVPHLGDMLGRFLRCPCADLALLDP